MNKTLFFANSTIHDRRVKKIAALTCQIFPQTDFVILVLQD